MKTLSRRLAPPGRKAPAVVRKGAGAVWNGVKAVSRIPKVLAKRRMSQRVMKILLAIPENERVPFKPLVQRPGFKSYGTRDSKGNFRIEVIDARGGFMEPVEERLFNSHGMLLRLISHVPGQGKYVWDYRKPGQWVGREQGIRPSRQTRALDKLRG